MGKRERKLPLPSPLERKAQGERAKKGIKDEPIKKREGFKDAFGGGYYVIDEAANVDWNKWKFQPGGVFKLNGTGRLQMWGTNDVQDVEPKKTPTEEWLEKWEQENELAEQ